MTTHLLFGIENPLLDISAVVKPELLEKYNIRPQDFKVIRAEGKTPIRTGGLVN